MIFENETQAEELLSEYGIEVSPDWDILYPRNGNFPSSVHEAIEYLMDEWDYDFKFIYHEN